MEDRTALLATFENIPCVPDIVAVEAAFISPVQHNEEIPGYQGLPHLIFSAVFANIYGICDQIELHM